MENNRIEYKRELTDRLEREVVAFLNARKGGTVYIGIDKDGAVFEVEDLIQFRKSPGKSAGEDGTDG